MYEHIMVAVDGSECAMDAAERARGLAELKPGMQVDLVYVVSPEQEIGAMHSPEMFDEIQSGSVAYPVLEKFKGVDAQIKGVRLYGNPASSLVKYAHDNDVDLIVMGTRGIRGFKKLRLGSVSEQVLKMASCPVMVVK